VCGWHDTAGLFHTGVEPRPQPHEKDRSPSPISGISADWIGTLVTEIGAAHRADHVVDLRAARNENCCSLIS
jgi:hypothetical protein